MHAPPLRVPAHHHGGVPARLPDDRPFTTADALRVGLSRRELDALIEAGAVTRKSHGRYAKTSANYLVRAHVVARLNELKSQSDATFVVAHHTAAVIHGLRTPSLPAAGMLTVLCAPSTRRPAYNDDVIILPANYVDDDVTLIDGIAVTTLERTALDLARGFSLSTAFVSLDHALTMGATRRRLMDVRDRMSGWPGTRILNQAIQLADGRSETALESASRGAMIAAGLPAPELQMWVEGTSGQHFRADFAWVEQRTIGESDGFGKFSDRGEYSKQTFRDSDLREAGWTVIHWSFEQIMAGRRPALQWLATALRAPLIPPLHCENSRKTRRVA